MPELKAVCRAVLRDFPQALGVAVVDLETGLCLAVAHTVPYFTQAYVDVVSAIAAEYFRGHAISNLERVLSSHVGHPVMHAVREIYLMTEGTTHLMAVIPERPNALLCVVVPRVVDPSAGQVLLKGAMAVVAPCCPAIPESR